MKNTLFFLTAASIPSSLAASCYTTAGANSIALPSSKFLSNSYCQALCIQHKYPVAATKNGQECACAEAVPGVDQKVGDEQCTVKCPGYPDENCKPTFLPCARILRSI